MSVGRLGLLEYYGTVIIDLRNSNPSRREYSAKVASYDELWLDLEKMVEPSGSVWIMARNIYDGGLLPYPMDLATRIRSLTSFKLRNLLAVYSKSTVRGSKPLAPVHFLVPFLVKSTKDYYFDKDAIREPHVFKDLEWGKRMIGKSGYGDHEKPRYSAKGRDPGNVFYKTTRDMGGRVIQIDPYLDKEFLEKIIKVSTKNGSIVASNLSSTEFAEEVDRLGRRLMVLEVP
jgi:hypothetical protein